MGFLKSAFKSLTPIGLASSAFGAVRGKDTGSALLSGIPFVGEGFAAQDQRDFNAQQAHTNRQWQEYMSNTKHQREMKDLKKAGLNPILTANTGASTPSGATATSGIASGAGSSAQATRDILNLTRAKAKADIKKTEQEVKVQKAQKQVLANTAKKANAETKNIEQANEKAKVDAEFNRENKDAINTMKLIDMGANSASSILDVFTGGIGRSIRNLFSPSNTYKEKGRTFRKPNKIPKTKYRKATRRK